MPSFTGLIGSVLKGASEPYVEAAAGELKNQQRASLESQLSDILYQRDQRIKEADTMRARTEEERKLSPDYIQKAAAAKVGSQVAELSAGKTANLPQLQAESKVSGQVAELDTATAARLPEKQAAFEANKEKTKYTAMINAGVPKAKADVLMAEYDAAAPQRKLELDNTINAEIDKVTKLGKSKPYLESAAAIDRTKSAGEEMVVRTREGYRGDGATPDKKDRAKNTIEMERQIKETNNEIGRVIGIGDPKKIADEISYLESQAKKGNEDAIKKLAKVKPLTDELNSLSRELRSYKRSDATGGSTTRGMSGASGASGTSGTSGNRPSLDSFNLR